MSLQDTRNDATANERVGADRPKQSQDTSVYPFNWAEDLKLAGVTAGCAVGLYALRSIPLPGRG